MAGLQPAKTCVARQLTNLFYTNFLGANLTGANLTGADLSNADVSNGGPYLTGATLCETKMWDGSTNMRDCIPTVKG